MANHRESCRGCFYRRKDRLSGTYEYCAFCLTTGNPRRCPADQCSRKLIKEPKRDKDPFSVKYGGYQ